MRSLRALRSASSIKPRFPLTRQLRHQHEEPHKYYFQGPNFVPPPPSPAFRYGASLPQRLLRSTLWAVLFGLVGGLTANVFTTWTWMHTVFTPGEEGDTMYLQLINERLDNEPLSKLLEADPEWTVMEGLAPDGLDRSLAGSRGVQIRHWINPSKASLIVMIHFGEGTEGHPQVVHGGILASFVHNAMELMAPYCFRPPKPHQEYNESTWTTLVEDGYFRANQFEISFERPVASGDVYCIWICPAFALGEDLLIEAAAHAKSRLPKIEREELQKSLIGSILQIDFFPYEAPQGQRFVRYANAVGVFGKINVAEPKKPVQLTMDGKII